MWLRCASTKYTEHYVEKRSDVLCFPDDGLLGKPKRRPEMRKITESHMSLLYQTTTVKLRAKAYAVSSHIISKTSLSTKYSPVKFGATHPGNTLRSTKYEAHMTQIVYS